MQGAALHRSTYDCDFGVLDIGNKNPIMALYERRQDLRYSLLNETGPDHDKIFTVGVTIDGDHFEGRGPTKKKAKYNAAKVALRVAFRVHFQAETGGFPYVGVYLFETG